MSGKQEIEEPREDTAPSGPDEGVDLPINLIKSLQRKETGNSSEGGSSSSNVGGNTSDNSALVSLGNTSFGFNFDSEEGNSGPNSDKSGESDSDGGGKGNPAPKTSPEAAEGNRSETTVHNVSESDEKSKSSEESKKTNATEETKSNESSEDKSEGQHQVPLKPESKPVEPAGLTKSPDNAAAEKVTASSDDQSSHSIAADKAVADLHSIANAFMKKEDDKDDKQGSSGNTGSADDDNDNNSSRAEQAHSSSAHSVGGTSTAGSFNDQNQDEDDEDGRPKKKKKVNDKKREERNAREKERSFRISKQINELRDLLSSGGVIVPKGTKSSVLTEAANYIRMLQQHQYRSEIDRHQLVQQIQMIGGGAHGPQAAQAIRHVAAKNGVWSLGNFGGVPPKSAMGHYKPGVNGDTTGDTQVDPIQQTKIEEHEYRSVFNNCAVGMAIASMGGAFIDCNQLFCQLSNYTKQEVCALTIFNLTARQDLQHAFDLISQMISPPMDAPNSNPQQPIVLRGAMNNRSDLGLGVALVKGDDGIAKFFCVTLIKNPASPFDESKPIPATIELIQGTPTLTRQVPKESAGLDSAPAFTTG